MSAAPEGAAAEAPGDAAPSRVPAPPAEPAPPAQAPGTGALTRSSSRSRTVALALLVAVLVIAAALRLKGIGWGLPYSLVNVDESTVLPKAFGAARGGLNPQFFYYPSFFFYVVGAAYLAAAPLLWVVKGANPLAVASFVTDPGPYFVLGRLVSAAAGTASVYLVYRLGREAFGRPAGLVAALLLALAPLHVAYSHMAVTDVTATMLSLLALLLLLQAARGAGGRRLVAGAVVAGLATSTKYNLGLLVLPATIAAVYACRAEVAARGSSSRGPSARGSSSRSAAPARAALAWARPLVLRVYLPMLVAFVLGSPFIVLDPGHFVHDFLRQNRIMARGWLGWENAGNGLWYNVHVNFTGALGALLLVVCLAGVAWALWRHSTLDLLLAPYSVVYVLYVSTWKELADRYLLPVLPLLILLGVRLCLDAALARPAWRRVTVPAVAVLLALAAVGPLTASLAFDASLSGADTRAVATRWIAQNLPAGSTIATETSGPQLHRLRERRYFTEAGAPAPPAFRVIRLRLPAPGLRNASHDLGWVREHGADYVVVSSLVSERVRAAAPYYPSVMRFYDELDAQASLVKTFSPGPGERGPVIKVYRL